jgi:hypothetical protein
VHARQHLDVVYGAMKTIGLIAVLLLLAAAAPACPEEKLEPGWRMKACFRFGEALTKLKKGMSESEVKAVLRDWQMLSTSGFQDGVLWQYGWGRVGFNNDGKLVAWGSASNCFEQRD